MEHWIEHATLQYPQNLWTPRPNGPNDNPNKVPRYGCMALLEGPAANSLQGVIDQVMAEVYPGQRTAHSLRQGVEKAHKPEVGYRVDNYFVNMTDSDKPFMCNTTKLDAQGNPAPIEQHDPEARDFYPGAQVRLLVDVWATAKQLPGEQRAPRVNVAIKGVQFLGHGPVLQGAQGGPVTGQQFGQAPLGHDPTGAPAQPQYQAPPAAPVAPPQYVPPTAPPQYQHAHQAPQAPQYQAPQYQAPQGQPPAPPAPAQPQYQAPPAAPPVAPGMPTPGMPGVPAAGQTAVPTVPTVPGAPPLPPMPPR